MPVAAGGDDERADALNGAEIGVELGAAAGASAPALVMDFQIEARRNVEVGLESGDLLLLTQAADQPVERELAGQELDDDLRLLEDGGNETEADEETGRRCPVDTEDLGVAREGGLDPEEDIGCLTAVIANEADVPPGHDDDAGQTFQNDGGPSPHVASDAARLRSDVRDQ